MAINLFEFQMVIKAIDQFSGVFKRAQQHVEQLNKAAKSMQPLREYSANLAMIGVAAGGAGAAMAYGLKQLIDPAMKMQGIWQHVAGAVQDGTQSLAHLNAAREFSEKLAVKSGLSEESLADSYYIARSNMLSHAEAIQAVSAASSLTIGTTKNFTDAMAAQEETTRTLTTLHKVLGGTIGSNADMLAKLQSAYSFHDITEVSAAVADVLPAAQRAGLGASQMMSALAIISRGGLHGQRAGVGLEEFLTQAVGKKEFAPFVRQTRQGGLDLIATLQAVSKASQGMSPLQMDRWAKTLGFSERSARGFGILVDGFRDFAAVNKDLANSQGMAATLAKIREASADYAFARFGQSGEQLKESLGGALLPALTSFADKMTGLVERMTEFTKYHSTIASMALKFAAIGSAVLIVGGGLALAGAALAGFASFVPAVGLLAGAMWSITAALAANPIGLLVIALAAAGAGFYELYKHFDYIKHLGSVLYDAGAHLIDSLVSGITSKLHAVGTAMTHVGAAIRSYLPFSPAKEGPLRDLNRLRLVETMADSMRPGPMIDAIRKVAAASAIAIPMAIGTASSPAIARTGTSMSGGGGINVTVNYAPNVVVGDGTSKEEFAKLLKEHAAEIKKIVARAAEDAKRVKY